MRFKRKTSQSKDSAGPGVGMSLACLRNGPWAAADWMRRDMVGGSRGTMVQGMLGHREEFAFIVFEIGSF